MTTVHLLSGVTSHFITDILLISMRTLNFIRSAGIVSQQFLRFLLLNSRYCVWCLMICFTCQSANIYRFVFVLFSLSLQQSIISRIVQIFKQIWLCVFSYFIPFIYNCIILWSKFDTIFIMFALLKQILMGPLKYTYMVPVHHFCP